MYSPDLFHRRTATTNGNYKLINFTLASLYDAVDSCWFKENVVQLLDLCVLNYNHSFINHTIGYI